MRIDDVIEGILQGETAPADGSTEAAWLATWRDRGLSDLDPEVMAALGGALADRLSWVFLAGYQATIYRCFPTLPRSAGWTSFVNTEDASGDLPGTSLEGDGDTRRLNGWKGWVAASDHVERLLVSAKQEHVPFAVLARETPGVRIESREAPGYLPDLSQGRAEFVDVTIPDGQLIGDERTFPTFRVAEGAYVRVALHAFILAHARRLEASPTLSSERFAARAEQALEG
jgi:alkylation response protein AidB-like acyl-CoA dehydrogenase